MASAAEIIAAIDTAILNWAGKPVVLSESGRSVTYRSLKQLLDARTYYQNQQNASGKHGVRITRPEYGDCK